MSADDHVAIRQYLEREASGTGNAGRRMVMNPRTGKFEIASGPGDNDDVAQITAEDMKSFGLSRAR